MNYLLPITDRDLYYKDVWRWITDIHDTDWAENQPPAQPQKDYTEGEFDNIQDRIANLKSSKKKSGK